MYVKLFSSILTSSIWTASLETRVLWITMLAMADRDGFVRASPSGLARMAVLDPVACRPALAELEGPDVESSNQKWGGRRIERLEGGWQIINYPDFRDLADADIRRQQVREAVRRYRAKQSRVITGKQPLAHTEAEAEADTDTLAIASGDEPRPESLGAWYGRCLKHLCKPQHTGPISGRKDEARDIHVLKHQLVRFDRGDVELAVAECRRAADANELGDWIRPGENFGLMALCAEPNGGIQTFERFLHAARKREEADRD